MVLKDFSLAGAHCETIERAVYTLYGGLARGFGERLDAQKHLSFARLPAWTHGTSAAHSGVASREYEIRPRLSVRRPEKVGSHICHDVLAGGGRSLWKSRMKPRFCRELEIERQ